MGNSKSELNAMQIHSQNYQIQYIYSSFFSKKNVPVWKISFYKLKLDSILKSVNSTQFDKFSIHLYHP